jgi:hypothetical protein
MTTALLIGIWFELSFIAALTLGPWLKETRS